MNAARFVQGCYRRSNLCNLPEAGNDPFKMHERPGLTIKRRRRTKQTLTPEFTLILSLLTSAISFAGHAAS